MAENRMKNQEQLEKKKKDVMDVDAKKEKALADQRKHENAALNSKVRQREADDASGIILSSPTAPSLPFGLQLFCSPFVSSERRRSVYLRWG